MPLEEATFFKKLADNSPLFVGMCDMQLIPFYVNAAGRRLVGLDDLQQFTKTPVREYFFPEDQDFIVNEFFSRVLKEGRAETEIRFRHFKTGKAIWMTYDVFFLEGEDGKPVGLATVSRDITEQKRVESALRESEERFASFMRHLPGFAWIKGLDGRYLFVNSSTKKALELSPEEFIGKKDEDIFPAETASQFHANDVIALSSEEGFTSIETLEKKDGSTLHVLVSKFPMKDFAGAPRAVGGVAIDVTDRVLAEQRLEEAVEQLRQADLRKDEFLAMLAHELRNPLAPIRNGLHVLRTLAEPDTQVRRVEEIMERQIAHLIRLVDDLLDVARIRSGKIRIKTERVAIENVVAEAVEMSRHSVESAGLKLRVHLPGETLPAEGDPVRLTQICANLLNNAAKFTPPGGTVTIAAERVNADVVIRVADTGRGIDGKALPHIFDLFAQGEEAETNKKSGLGVGLALVRKLAELHGGSVSAHSDGENLGSVFTVRLPAVKC